MSSNFTGLEFKKHQNDYIITSPTIFNTDFLFLSCFLDQSINVKMSKSKKRRKSIKKINGEENNLCSLVYLKHGKLIVLHYISQIFISQMILLMSHD